MINESIMFSMGDFVWWLGKVIDIDDPKKTGRVKIRAYGFYSDEIPEEDLPWATVIGSIRSASLSGTGESPTGMLKDSTVFGFFIDGQTAQIPVIMGTLYGEGDVHGYATGSGGGGVSQNAHSSKSKGGKSFGAPGSARNAKYPYNHVISGINGVIVEYDNTKDYERYAWQHPRGTWFEAQPNGDQVNKIAKDRYTVTAGDDYLLVDGNVKIFVAGNAHVTVDGNVDYDIGGSLNINVGGNYNLNVGGQYILTGQNGGISTFTADHLLKARNIYLN